MLRRITAVMTALFVLFCTLPTLADDYDDESWNDDEFEDVSIFEAEFMETGFSDPTENEYYDDTEDSE